MQTILEFLEGFALFLAGCAEQFAAFLVKPDPMNLLTKELLIALATSVLAAVFVRGFIKRAENKRRRELLAPMRDLAVQSVLGAHSALYDHLQAFGERDYKRIETRVARLQGQFASTIAELKVRMVNFIHYFESEERKAFALYWDAADAQQISASSARSEIETWVLGINQKLRQLAQALPSKERKTLNNAVWDQPSMDELREPLLDRFKTGLHSVAASSVPQVEPLKFQARLDQR